MDEDTDTAYERYGAWTDDRGNSIPCAFPEGLPNLTSAERAVHEALTDPVWSRTRRIEQERIPLDVALKSVTAITGASAVRDGAQSCHAERQGGAGLRRATHETIP